MGGSISRLSSIIGSLTGTTEKRILILGLDNAGKTTILYRLKMDESVSTIPTMGFNVESIQYKNLSFQAWDLGGQSSIRPYWRCYYANTDAIVYVVDSSDRDRIGVSQKEFELMLQEAELKNAVLLVLANKQDVKGAMTQAEVSEHLGLPSIKNRQWAIYRCVATEGTGIEEGFDWVANAIKNA